MFARCRCPSRKGGRNPVPVPSSCAGCGIDGIHRDCCIRSPPAGIGARNCGGCCSGAKFRRKSAPEGHARAQAGGGKTVEAFADDLEAQGGYAMHQVTRPRLQAAASIAAGTLAALGGAAERQPHRKIVPFEPRQQCTHSLTLLRIDQRKANPGCGDCYVRSVNITRLYERGTACYRADLIRSTRPIDAVAQGRMSANNQAFLIDLDPAVV